MNASPPILDRLSTLGELTRCRLLALLERQELTVSELCQALQLPQPTVSRHLKVLSDDGWVSARADGTARHYRGVDPLPPGSADLWAVVREQLEGTARAAEDRERARAVVARRQDRARAFVSASAERWDDVRAELYGARADLLPLFGLLEPTWIVADLGTGSGVLPAAVAPYVTRAVGVDRSPEMLAAARRRTADLPNVELLAGELEALPLESGTVDLAFLSLVLHFVPEPSRALAEAERILRPGGRLILVDQRRHGRDEYRDEMGHQWSGFDPAPLASWLTAVGLMPGPVRPLPPDPHARGPLLFVCTARKPGP
jgi:ArsR family transcriptional regulator